MWLCTMPASLTRRAIAQPSDRFDWRLKVRFNSPQCIASAIEAELIRQRSHEAIITKPITVLFSLQGAEQCFKLPKCRHGPIKLSLSSHLCLIAVLIYRIIQRTAQRVLIVSHALCTPGHSVSATKGKRVNAVFEDIQNLGHRLCERCQAEQAVLANNGGEELLVDI